MLIQIQHWSTQAPEIEHRNRTRPTSQQQNGNRRSCHRGGIHSGIAQSRLCGTIRSHSATTHQDPNGYEGSRRGRENLENNPGTTPTQGVPRPLQSPLTASGSRTGAMTGPSSSRRYREGLPCAHGTAIPTTKVSPPWPSRATAHDSPLPPTMASS